MREGGGVLLVLLVLLLSVALVASLGLTGGHPPSQHASAVSAQLAQARDALIEYAVSYPQNYHVNAAGPGKFPCPDTNGDGNSGPRCPQLAIGLLPDDFVTATGTVQELQLERNLATEPLWWVVAGAFRNRPAPSGSPSHSMILNANTDPLLRLDGFTDVIGLLIAPGPPLAGQVRGGELRVQDYLEGENADGDQHFSRTAGNDRVVVIRREDVIPLVERQVLSVMRDTLLQYRDLNGRFPDLAPLDAMDASGDLACRVCQASGWLAVPRYRGSADWAGDQFCTDETGTESRQPIVDMPGWLVRNFWHTGVWLHLYKPVCAQQPTLDGLSVEGLLAAAGSALQSPPSGQDQNRNPAELVDLLDHAVNTDGDGDYLRAAGGNDIWLSIPSEALE